MQKLLDYYTQLLTRHIGEYDSIRKRLRLLSTSRLLAFVTTLLLIFYFKDDVKWATGFSIAGLALFLFLVRYYEDAKIKFRLAHALVRINKTELKVLQHNYEDLPNGQEYVDTQHPFSHDMDLFGKGSFFQYLNRTQLLDGQDTLAQLFTANDVEAIGAKQETIDELAQRPDWRQNFSANASLIEQELRTEEVLKWLNSYVPFVPKIMRILPWLFLMGFVGLAFVTYMLQWSFLPLTLWIFFGLGITGRYFKQITQLAQKADRVKAFFGQHTTLLKIIEETEFEAPQLRYQKQRLKVAQRNASEAIGKFSRLLNTMDYNNNIFYAIFGNGCFLGALWTAYSIEGWIRTHRTNVSEWFDVLAFFDAHNCLGNFSFNHPLYSYPVVINETSVLACKELGHPLIPEHNNVRNDFEIREEDFFIITGSNMAGKSTFLRSVGLCMIMANLGLPVNATDCMYNPKKLVTSMRSVDSLYKGDSYFLSELKRLQIVVRLLEQGSYFVLLDEILKGTNSADKASGSKKFLARLIRVKATGLIATHDLSLCETADNFSNVFNYHLDATIKDGELSFDYLLKEGVSKTMNASFLLEK